MLIVLGLYASLVWLVVFRLKLLPWGFVTKTVVYGIGIAIALVVIGALNHLTPRGPVSVQGVVIEMTPNVAGTVVEVAVEPTQKVAQGDLLFRIDPTPFATDVKRLEAALLQAQSGVQQLRSDLLAAQADVERMEAQLRFGIKRRDDFVQLAERGASTEFKMEEAISNIEQAEAGLRAARARQERVKTRIAAQIDGEDAAVVQARQALSTAKWKLEQTEVLAPADGIVSAVTLRAGARVTTLRPALAFAPDGQKALVASFPQSGLHAIGIGDEVLVALRSMPGSYFVAQVDSLPVGTREGAVTSGGVLPTIRQLTGTGEFVARIALPPDLPADVVRLGVSGTALRITDNAGPMEPLARVLFWLSRMRNYL